MSLPPIERIAELLGGEVSGNQVRAPGPATALAIDLLASCSTRARRKVSWSILCGRRCACVPRSCPRPAGTAAVRGEEEKSQRQGQWQVVGAARRICLPRRARRAVPSRQETFRRCRQETVSSVPLGRHAVAQGQAGGIEDSVSPARAARGADGGGLLLRGREGRRQSRQQGLRGRHQCERGCQREMGARADPILQGPARRDPARRRRARPQARPQGREGPL